MAGKSRLAATCVAVALVLLFRQSMPQGQQPQQPVQISAAVRAAAAQGQQVRVIVGVRVAGYRAEGGLAVADAAAQRATMQAAVQGVLSRLPAAVSSRSRAFDFIPYFNTTIDLNTLLQLEADPEVASIEEDRLNFPTLAQSVPLIGGNTVWSAGFTGVGQTVAVIDSGVDKFHPFLAGKVVAEGCYSNAGFSGPASLCPGGVGFTTAVGSGVNCSMTTVSPLCFHGTHVAGIAAGKGTTFSGVAKDATIMAFQVFTNGGGGNIGAATSDYIAALNRVYALRGSFNIAAVNMSLGGGRFFTQCDATEPAARAAIDLLRSANIPTIIASGNNGYVDSIGSPACISIAVSVGSTTKAGGVSSFSNAYPFLHLLAPGGEDAAPSDNITSSAPGNTFVGAHGTSMAAPHVAGAWALLKQRVPAAGINDILSALRNTGVPVLDSGNGLVFPRIRVDLALNKITIPLVGINSPANGATVGPNFLVSGWSLDRGAVAGTTGVDQVHVYAFPAGGGAPIGLGVATYGIARPDVAGVFGPQFTNSGFTLNAGGLPNGTYQITIYGRSTVSGTFNAIQSVTVTVSAPPPQPVILLGAPLSNSTSGSTVTVNGFAIDLGAPTGTGVDQVHVYAFPTGGGSPIGMGAATYGLSRPDVGGIWGSRFTNSGFQRQAVVPPGNYTIVAYMRSTVTGTFIASASSANVTVNSTNSNPMMLMDGPPNGSSRSRPFVISGWAVDTGAAAGTGINAIHIWAFPVGGGAPFLVGVGTYGTSRPDVGSYLGDSRFNNSGFNFTVTSGNVPSPGTYDFQIFGRSTVTGGFTVARVIRVTVG